MSTPARNTAMQDLPKPVKRAVRELCSLAHERELNRELGLLLESFQQWQQGALDAFELSQRIHQFHQGPARELYVRYVNNSLAELMVARALLDGVIAESDIPDVAREHLLAAAERIRSF
jgi:hypothetical protein